MPVYEFKCTACDHRFDIKMGIHDDPPTSCPECGEAVKKVFSPVGISFKGSGFYKNDSRGSRSKSSSSATASTSTTDSSSSASSESTSSKSSDTKSTETKTATKTESKSAK
ncbi:MAG: FmdB family transcriptional regulator [Actinobacteria bacterium]|nr:FmdB family transcriptional regulator [Actinomycetota bacterium]MCB9389703.1 FmdB family transcriptional regulator [Acidimicrobiia bacterium]